MFKSEAQIVLNRDPRQTIGGMEQGHSSTAPGAMSGGVGAGNTAAPGGGGGGGGGGMPFFPMSGGMMVGEAGLADEFMKLQQDFFKWQQQLLQNQHVLHSRVAPLASNPPQLQSVGVMRDILGQQVPPNGSPQEVAEAHNPSVGMGGAGVRRQPVERIINIRFEDGPSETNEAELHGPTFSRTGPIPDLTRDMAQMTTGPRPQQQQQPARRWEEPNITVAAWRDRPATQDTPTYPPMPSPTPLTPQPLSQAAPQQRTSPRPQGPRGYSRPAEGSDNSNRPFQWPPASSESPPPPPQQFQSLPPEQKQQFAQFMQQQQQQQQQPTWPPKQQEQQQQQHQYQPPPQQAQQPSQLQPQQATWPPKQPSPQPQQEQQPSQLQPQQATWPPKQPSPQPQQAQQADKTAFWRELESKRQGLGLAQEEEETEPARAARGGSRQDSPSQYYYNGDTPQAPPAGGGGPRYTSVVTVAADRDRAEEAGRDKVRSVVQLNAEQQQQQQPPRAAPVVRGFRQPGQDQPLQSRTFGSAATSRSSVSPPAAAAAATNGLQAPAAARLVAAAATPPQRESPPRASPPQGFPGVQLRPVPSRASPPSEVTQPGGAPPPPPPPAPPMAPPPPPAPAMPQGERRTATGKKIVSAKSGPELDARQELMMAIRGHGGIKSLRRTQHPLHQ